MRESNDQRFGQHLREVAVAGRGSRIVLIMAMMLAALISVTASPASAATAASAASSGVVSTPRGTQVVTPDSTTVVKLINDYTGKCVDDSNDYGLRAIACKQGDGNQKWLLKVSATNPDLPQVLQDQSTGLCLDDSFSNGLRAIKCNGDDNQGWDVLYDATFALQGDYTGYCMDDSAKYGLRAIGCRQNDGNQQWNFG
jgi:hypothetical protein